MLTEALRYALIGWPVIPLRPGSKEPLTAHGVHDCTTDPEQIGDWWATWSEANIGLAIGDDRVVFDVDPRHGGNIAYLKRLGLDMFQAPTQRTASGGWHVVYHKPRVALVARLPNMPGLDVLSGARYIVAEPSTVNGRQYRWERHPLDIDPVRLPMEVVDRLRKPRQRTSSTTTAKDTPPSLRLLEDALMHLDPWSNEYDWWVSILMGIHNADPGPDGLALAERWGAGKPGEVASKWAGFDRDGGVTYHMVLREAAANGWNAALMAAMAMCTNGAASS